MIAGDCPGMPASFIQAACVTYRAYLRLMDAAMRARTPSAAIRFDGVRSTWTLGRHQVRASATDDASVRFELVTVNDRDTKVGSYSRIDRLDPARRSRSSCSIFSRPASRGIKVSLRRDSVDDLRCAADLFHPARWRPVAVHARACGGARFADGVSARPAERCRHDAARDPRDLRSLGGAATDGEFAARTDYLHRYKDALRLLRLSPGDVRGAVSGAGFAGGRRRGNCGACGRRDWGADGARARLRSRRVRAVHAGGSRRLRYRSFRSR